MGHRIAKHIYTSANVWEKSTYYVRDAQGNVMSVYEHKVDNTAQTLTYTQQEKHIYGSSRVGMDVAEKDMITPTITEQSFYRESGKKQYELSNHLGNVLTVITDKKIPVENINITGEVEYFIVEIIFATDYSPFGVTLKEREFTSEKYRYGFNGKEMDNEIMGQGNSYDYGMRMEDPRLGRFLSIDPMFQEFPFNSSYAYAENSPVKFIDLDGLEKEDPVSKCFIFDDDVKRPCRKIMWAYKEVSVTKLKPIRQDNTSASKWDSGLNRTFDFKGTGQLRFDAQNIEDGIQIIDLSTNQSVYNNQMVQGQIQLQVQPGRYRVIVTPTTDPDDRTHNANTVWSLQTQDNWQKVVQRNKIKVLGIPIWSEKKRQFQDPLNPANNSPNRIVSKFLGIPYKIEWENTDIRPRGNQIDVDKWKYKSKKRYVRGFGKLKDKL